MLRRERVVLSVLILIALIVLWNFYSITKEVKMPLMNLCWNHPCMRDKTDKIYITVKTSTKYHKKRLAPLLVTWMQTVKPHQVCVYMCVCVCVCVCVIMWLCVCICMCIIRNTCTQVFNQLLITVDSFQLFFASLIHLTYTHHCLQILNITI